MRSGFITVFLTVTCVYSQACFEEREKGTSEGCSSPEPGTKFYFDPKTKVCQPFYFLGCGGSENRFETAEKCRTACSDTHNSRPPKSKRKCKSKAPAAIDKEGNYVECNACPKGYSCEDDICCPSKGYACGLPYDAGKFTSDGKMSAHFFFSPKFNNCMLFTYYGSFGNANNFENYYECMKFCKDK